MSSSYPTDTDLQQKIESLGVVDTGGTAFAKINLASKVAAAIATWEQRTGWTPYLATLDANGIPAETTRLFDAPSGPVLSLRGGVLSVSALTVFDFSYDLGGDFYLQPGDAPGRGKPFTEIRFLSRIASRLPQCIAVTGVWGRTLSLEADSFEAILGQATALCVPEIALQISNGLYKIDDVQYAGSSLTPLSAERAMWETDFKAAAQGKKRVTV